MRSSTAYCPTCRTYFKVPENPPYAVIHLIGSHLHPITRQVLEEV